VRVCGCSCYRGWGGESVVVPVAGGWGGESVVVPVAGGWGCESVVVHVAGGWGCEGFSELPYAFKLFGFPIF
jgi:hypothetical protein